MGIQRAFLWLLLLAVVVRSEDAGDDQSNDDGNLQTLEGCNGIVQITSLEVLCDSPYTFYYGNGAHRNSAYCDYGDKATIKVSFYVTDDLGDTTIYMQMGAYTDNDEELFKSQSVDVCGSYVGSSCSYEASYSFSKQVQFAYIDGDQTQFVPFMEFAFSSQADGGYNLGGANIDCDMSNQDYFIDWMNGRTNSTVLQYRTQSFLSNYGILLGTIAVLGFFVFLLVKQHSDRIEEEGMADPKHVELIQRQL